MNQWAGIKITDGTDQDERIAAALQPGYFNVDELTFEALLAMGAEFAAKVNFYNLRNKVDGNWGELFSADEAVIMAMILSSDLQRLEADFSRSYSTGLEELALYVYQQAVKFNFWLTRLNAAEQGDGQGLGQKIAALVEEKLIVELHTLGTIVSRLKNGSSTMADIDFAIFSGHWALGIEAGRQRHFPQAKMVATENGTLTRQQLRTVFYTFFNAISYLKSITPIYLQESLGSQLHDPATGLFMAFIKLYQRAQQKLNSFTQRHLDFYYSDILGVTPQAALPESLYLHFEAEAGAKALLIAKGSEFSAGKDDTLREIVYRSNNDLWLTDARVVSLCTLYLQRDELLSPEYELGYVSRIKSNKIELPTTTTAEGELHAWPLFGAEKPGMTTESASDANIGFAITSPLLLLKEGERRIEISVILGDTVDANALLMTSLLGRASSEHEFIKLFGRMMSRYLFNNDGWLNETIKDEVIAKADSLLSKVSADEVRQLLNQERLDLFYKLFKKIFTLKLTGRDGWIEVVDYLVTPFSTGGARAAMGFKLLFSLGHEVGAITPYRSDIHGDGFDATGPLLQCCINPHSNFYPYSLFHDLLLQRIEIDVEVIGLKSLQAYNNHGQLDPSKPFLPFGPLPSTNSFFVVGAHEIATKMVTDLNLVLEWAELPADGFERHYGGYGSAYKNGGFKVDFATLADGVWQPKEVCDRPRQSLFATAPEGGGVDAHARLNVAVLKYSKSVDANLPEEMFAYDIAAREGFFKLSLVEPITAFGHRDYPALLTELLSENARRKKPLPIPNPPYTPMLNRISLDYRARAVVDMIQGRSEQKGVASEFYHIHPFGIEKVERATAEKSAFLMPQYGYEGNLFIGLSASQLAGTLTLFFHLAEDMAEEMAPESNAINWFYLCDNRWKPLEKVQILSDSTDGFLSSGVVTLNIPSEISRHNSVMPDNIFWLRASTRRDMLSFCSAYSVQAHAVKLTHHTGNNRSAQTKIADAAKWQTMVSIPGVGRITQAGKRLAGTPGETRQQLITRVSEQLHHKNRASTPRDYERLILQQFSSVYKVKCFPNMVSSGSYPRPGHLLIVVVPYLRQGERQGCPKAMMNSVELGRIRKFVQHLASPFATIEVRNPSYEQVQVRCSVKFKSEAMGGHYLNRLDKAVADYICPWEKTGYKARFGWSIRQKDIESYIRGLEYVEYVTNFSMLHITEDGKGGYYLYDSANTSAVTPDSSREVVIRQRYPWSLAVPAKHQFIEMIQTISPINAEVTGVNELEIGGTFIISGNSDNGKEE